MKKYQDWIEQYKKNHDGNVLGRCLDACKQMRKEFPELAEVRGHVFCSWGKRGHAWLQTESGEIIDPTREQFPGPIMYEQWKPGDKVKAGVCMDCGKDLWVAINSLEEIPANPMFCSDACRKSTALYLNGTTEL